MVRLAKTRVPHENMTDFRRIREKDNNSSGNESQCSSIKINVGMFTHCGFDCSIFLAAACSWCICEDNLPLKAKVTRYYWAVGSRTASPSAVMYHLAMSSTREKNNTNSVHTHKKKVSESSGCCSMLAFAHRKLSAAFWCMLHMVDQQCRLHTAQTTTSDILFKN